MYIYREAAASIAVFLTTAVFRLGNPRWNVNNQRPYSTCLEHGLINWRDGVLNFGNNPSIVKKLEDKPMAFKNQREC